MHQFLLPSVLWHFASKSVGTFYVCSGRDLRAGIEVVHPFWCRTNCLLLECTVLFWKALLIWEAYLPSDICCFCDMHDIWYFLLWHASMTFPTVTFIHIYWTSTPLRLLVGLWPVWALVEGPSTHADLSEYRLYFFFMSKFTSLSHPPRFPTHRLSRA
jgi:hypothetical protein